MPLHPPVYHLSIIGYTVEVEPWVQLHDSRDVCAKGSGRAEKTSSCQGRHFLRTLIAVILFAGMMAGCRTVGLGPDLSGRGYTVRS